MFKEQCGCDQGGAVRIGPKVRTLVLPAMNSIPTSFIIVEKELVNSATDQIRLEGMSKPAMKIVCVSSF